MRLKPNFGALSMIQKKKKEKKGNGNKNKNKNKAKPTMRKKIMS